MAKDSSVAIDVVGLKDFQRELRQMDKAWAKELRVANKKAAEPIAKDTRSSFASRPGVAPKVAASVKVLAEQRSASIKIGGDKYPYAMGSEFGSIQFKQFPPHRGSGSEAGYSLYPSIRSNRENVINVYGDLIDEVAKAAFPK